MSDAPEPPAMLPSGPARTRASPIHADARPSGAAPSSGTVVATGDRPPASDGARAASRCGPVDDPRETARTDRRVRTSGRRIAHDGPPQAEGAPPATAGPAPGGARQAPAPRTVRPGGGMLFGPRPGRTAAIHAPVPPRSEVPA